MAQLDPKYRYKYQAAASADVVVKNKPGFLHAIVLGCFVSGGIIEVSNHASDGDGSVQIYLTCGTTDTAFPKTIIVDAWFETGICVDQTNFTNVTYIYR